MLTFGKLLWGLVLFGLWGGSTAVLMLLGFNLNQSVIGGFRSFLYSAGLAPAIGDILNLVFSLIIFIGAPIVSFVGVAKIHAIAKKGVAHGP